MSRIRTYTIPNRRGTRFYRRYLNGVLVTTSGITTNSASLAKKLASTCTDDLHPYPYLTDGTLDVLRKEVRPVVLNGNSSPFGPSNDYYVDTYSSYIVEASVSTAHWPTLPPASYSYWTTAALANINPSNPIVDIPLFLFELREFPKMLRDAGRVLSGRSFRALRPDQVHLSFQFGWKPLFMDLMRLLSLAESLEERKRLLIRASEKGGTRISRKLGSFDYSRVSSGFEAIRQLATPSSSVANYAASSIWDGYEKAWYTARLSIPPGFLEPGNLETTAARAALGLNLSAASIWNAIPWSWLIDYFINIGNFLDATRGYIPFRVTRFNVMVYQEYKRNLAVTQKRVSYSGGYGKISNKGRRLPSPIARIAFKPFLTNGQIANIAALITARAFSR